MAKQLSFSYKEKDYNLEFTRRTVTELERRGFIASELTDKPMTSLPTLFAGAFLANHRYVKPELIDEIFSHMGNRETLIGKLVEMYNEPIMTLVEEPEDAEKNVIWAASF